MLTGQTSPPPLLTEADLISLMERHGIGTDATHADHIETIKQRLYVGLEQAKFLVPGQLGMGLVEGKIDKVWWRLMVIEFISFFANWKKTVSAVIFQLES